METDKQLLDKASELQEQAVGVIRHLELLERWGTVGSPVLVGSVRFGLLASPNLDLEVYTDTPDVGKGFEVVAALASVPGVEQVHYLNALDTPDQGLYWRIDYRDEQGRLWDIDNWLVANSHPDAGMADALALAMAQNLDEQSRVKILRIKNALKPVQPTRGIDIYKSVLEGGASTVEEFEAYIAENEPPYIEKWRP